ncbi:penicillin-binding transpeptidase domain-containing protein [Brevibacterium sp.]|uniref:penicillin-binding transpeptidase domain-containing protein n=1 Tax=Brevibacterium sp. TaxID=1701 RepID=UPI0025B80EEB|nr:penicillin-binding transpeptidase domain-containing protein [Brevibacterium sp.]
MNRIRSLTARTWMLIAACAVVLALVVTAVLVLPLGDSAEEAAERALPALQQTSPEDGAAGGEGPLAAAGWIVPEADAPGTGPDEEYARIASGMGGLDSTGPFGPPAVSLGGVTEHSGGAEATLHWTWPHGDRAWEHTSVLRLEKRDGEWAPVMEPRAVHADLQAGESLGTQVDRPERGRILGAGDEVLAGPQPVVVVGVEPRRAEDVEELSDALEEHLDIDGDALADRIEAAADDAFVEVITLRRDDYDEVSDDIRLLPGTVFREEEQPLGRSRTFAAATLGSAGPATAEDIENSEGRHTAGDVVGRSGLNRAFDGELGGLRTVVVNRVDAEDGKHELGTVEGEEGSDVATTLDVDVQEAADAATADGDKPAALVALRPSDGHVLASSSSDPEGGAFDRALASRYPPGSIFKVASGLALLRAGVTPEDVLACPETTDVEGKVFTNAEDFGLGESTFAEDFVQSCNTAFVDAATRADGEALASAAADLGMGLANGIGTDAFGSAVPVEDDPVTHAAMMIGQGTAEASPLGAAVMAASVAQGETVEPVLVPEAVESAEEGGSGPGTGELEPGHVEALQELMAETVTDGTASALRDVPGPAVHGKTGTAEYGGETPPRTHSWFVGYQGDLAFAVLVEDGGFGAEAAVPMAEDFLRALHD